MSRALATDIIQPPKSAHVLSVALSMGQGTQRTQAEHAKAQGQQPL